jgi:tetratricopeptide (TPR) repeat protein
VSNGITRNVVKKKNQSTRPAETAQAESEPTAPTLKLFVIRYRSEILVCLLLVIATAAVYWRLNSHQFINLDDDVYVYENATVRAGLTMHGFRWAITTFQAANWHPLTWLSHMLDVQLFGLKAGRHLYTNLALHILNSLLLFLALRRMTGAVWRSAFVAALFALHPLHVESVAWVSERKDVLSGLFFMLTLYAYAVYAEKSDSWPRYLLVIAGLLLGLTAKPMLVTMPFVLLLLDYWPLHRLQWNPPEGAKALFLKALPLIREKVPLFALIVASSVVTYMAQQHGGAVKSFSRFSLAERLVNVLAAYGIYLRKMLLPIDLAVYYPFEQSHPPAQLIATALVLFGTSTLTIFAARRYDYLRTGWLWYLGMLVPVIGFVQVGEQALADRYTYLPLIGLFVMVAWGVADLIKGWRYRRLIAALTAAAIVATLSVLTWRQVQRWRDNETLYGHTLAVTSNNYVILTNLGYALAKSGRRAEGIELLNEALQIEPGFFEAENSLGAALLQAKRPEEALPHFEIALSRNPDSAKVHSNMGAALGTLGRLDEAVAHLREALGLDPTYPNSSFNLGIILLTQKKNEEALQRLAEAVQLQPEGAETHNAYGYALLVEKRPAEAIEQFQIALNLNPNYAQAQKNLRNAQIQLGQQPQ